MKNEDLGSATEESLGSNKVIDKNGTIHPKLNNRADYPRLVSNHKEEYAAEVASTPVRMRDIPKSRDTDVEDFDRSTGNLAGYVGLALGLVSLFMWSIVLGPISIMMGYYAYFQGKKVTGTWAMGLGVLATISYLVLIPLGRS
ncbi:hypothetical protein [Paenibacillus sp. CMAA1364]